MQSVVRVPPRVVVVALGIVCFVLICLTSYNVELHNAIMFVVLNN